jgi:AcrR family transcriptional regulator
MARSDSQSKKAVDSATKNATPTSETARPRTRKDEILEAARRILIEEGHHRLTLRNVAENVGIKLASLQYHFPTKTELITALMDSGNDSYQSLLESLLGVVDSSISDEAVVAILDRVFEEYQDERSLNFHEQLWALSVRDEQSMEQYLKGYSDVWDSAAEMIGRFDPESTQDQRQTRAALIIALVDGLETFLRAEPLRRRLPATMKKSVSNLIRSIARGEARS